MMGLPAFVLRQILQSLGVFGQTLYYIVRGHWHLPDVWKQLFVIGNRSVFFIVVTLGFLGAIISLQTGYQALRVFGDTSLTGAQTFPILLRQLGPTLTGLMFATRVGTGIAAEIGSMVVTEQVDALRMCNAPPVDYLIKPRFVASTLMVPALTIIGITSAFFAGMLVSYLVFNLNPATYANFDMVHTNEIAEGLVKSVVFGMVIPIIAGASGLAAKGGSEGVGEATTQAVVNTSLAVIIPDFIIGGLFFVGRAA